MHIGNRLVELRKQQHLSTNKLANLAGISQSYLRDIELGTKNPTVEILSLLCDALHISLATFFAPPDSAISPALLTAIHRLTPREQEALAVFLHTMHTSESNED